jgi:hypothetical protein
LAAGYFLIIFPREQAGPFKTSAEHSIFRENSGGWRGQEARSLKIFPGILGISRQQIDPRHDLVAFASGSLKSNQEG